MSGYRIRFDAIVYKQTSQQSSRFNRGMNNPYQSVKGLFLVDNRCLQLNIKIIYGNVRLIKNKRGFLCAIQNK